MATKTQVTRLLAKQGATWSEKRLFDEYEFEAILPEPWIWKNGQGSADGGCGAFAQTRMNGEPMSEFWSDVMSMIDHEVIDPSSAT